MALNSILRTSASRVAPLAARLIGGQRDFYRHPSALFSAAAVVTQINLSGELLPASFTSGRHYCSSPNRPSSDESLHKVIESEIVCAEESDVSNEVQEAPEGFPFKIEDNPSQQTISHIPPVVRVARSGFNKYLGMKPSAANLHPKIRGIKPITVINFFPKRTFIHFFLPRRPRRQIRRTNSRLGKGWGPLRKVGPIRCLHSRDRTEERNEMRGQGTGKRVESISLDDSEKQNKIRIWPKKKQPIKNNISKLLRDSGAFKHPKYAGVVNDIDFLIKNDDSFRKTKFFKFFFSNPKKSGPKKSGSDSLTSHLPKRALLPAVRPSFHYSVMQYLLNTKNKMHFDPVVVLKHFLAPQSTKTSENSWRG